MERVKNIGNAKLISLALMFALVISISTVFLMLAHIRIANFENLIATEGEKTKLIVSDDVRKFEFGLQGARGVFLADQLRFDRAQFRGYSESRNHFSNFSGALGFGFIRAVRRNEYEAYQKLMRARLSGFEVHPVFDTPLHMIIELIEPIERNGPALGLDVSFETNRRTAAEFSARTGQTALTDPIQLVQSSDTKPGFLYFLPIYTTARTPDTEEERMRQLVGWAYAPIRAEQLVADIEKKISPNLVLKIQFDNGAEELGTGPVVRRSSVFKNYWNSQMEFGGRKWTIEVSQDTEELQTYLLLLGISYFVFIGASIFGAARLVRFAISRDRALTENILWLDAALNSAAHFFITTDEVGRITALNRFAERKLGQNGEHAVGQSFSIFHDPEELRERSQELSEKLGRNIKPDFGFFIAQCEIQGLEAGQWTYIAKDKTRIPVRVKVTSIKGPTDSNVGYLIVAEDMTQQIEMSKTIEIQRSKMMQESKMATLGEMAGGMAHEINTPLATILGTTENLKLLMENNSFDQTSMMRLLNRIETTTERIAKIVRGLRSFARNADSDPMLPVEVREIVDGVLGFCGEKFKNHSVEIQIDVPTGLFITCREVQISQVLMNLVSNSFDAVKEQAERKIAISAFTVGDTLELRVVDSGKGIEPEIADKVMLPFFTTKAIGEGTGLGLSVSLGIARAHGGDLRFLREEAFTTFCLNVPISATQRSAG